MGGRAYFCRMPRLFLGDFFATSSFFEVGGRFGAVFYVLYLIVFKIKNSNPLCVSRLDGGLEFLKIQVIVLKLVFSCVD